MNDAHVIPALRYGDAEAAIDFLCDAFGFERHLVVPMEGGGVKHAQLTFRNGMVMLGSRRGDETDEGYARQSIYVVVEDVDAHHARAAAAGAEITLPPTPQPHAGSMYSAHDPEGHDWHFGDYDPWAPPPE